MGFCSKGLKNKFETAVVNEPSMFEPLKFYCTSEVSILPSALPKFSKLIGQFIALSKKAGKEMHPANSTTCTGLHSIIYSRTFLNGEFKRGRNSFVGNSRSRSPVNAIDEECAIRFGILYS